MYSVTDLTHSVESESSVLTDDTLHLKHCSLVRKVSGRLISRTGWEMLRGPRSSSTRVLVEGAWGHRWT